MATITDSLLNNIAKAMNGETFKIFDYLSVATTEVTAIDTTSTSLDGEIGTRIGTSYSRTDNTVTVTALRSGVDVIDTVNGDILYTSGLNGDLTDELLTGTIHAGVTQTTDYDIQFEYTFTFGR